MFVSCPHCGFLVALVAARSGAMQRCPRCEGSLQAGTETTASAAKPAAPARTAATRATATRASVAASAPAAATGSTDTAAAPAAATPPADDAVTTTASAAAATSATATHDDATAATTEATATADTESTPSFEEAIAASAIAPAQPRAKPARPGNARPRATPSFARLRAAEPARPTHWRGYAAIAALSLLLVLQLLLAQRAELAAQERWRPLVAAVCGVLRCQLPPWHEPSAFTMLNRSVQPKVGMPGVLTVSASFRNDAHWPQPWPTLVLSLSDIDGQPVGQRAFRASEYRDGDDALLAPGQSAVVQLDVIEPAPRIVAFTFDFR